MVEENLAGPSKQPLGMELGWGQGEKGVHLSGGKLEVEPIKRGGQALPGHLHLRTS